MKLRFKEAEIRYWADRYDYPRQVDANLVSEVKQCGFLTLDQLSSVAQWKSPRSAGHVKSNNDDYVRAITDFALHHFGGVQSGRSSLASRLRASAMVSGSRVMWTS